MTAAESRTFVLLFLRVWYYGYAEIMGESALLVIHNFLGSTRAQTKAAKGAHALKVTSTRKVNQITVIKCSECDYTITIKKKFFDMEYQGSK